LREVDRLLKKGHTHVVDADLKGYFDTIPHDRLMALVEGSISDGRVLSLIESFLHQDIMTETARWQPETGTPQGAVLSPLLANLYLHPLDLVMERSGYRMVRYADDCVPRTHRRKRWCGTVRKMRVGPSEPAVRGRLQITVSRGGKEPSW
jgi:RNA-directed DNA polymerase